MYVRLLVYAMKQIGIYLVIHMDPIEINNEQLQAAKKKVEHVVKGIDEVLSIHDFRMVQGQGHENLIFDVLIPLDLKGEEKMIQKSIEHALNTIEPKTYYTKITFDTAFVHN